MCLCAYIFHNNNVISLLIILLLNFVTVYPIWYYLLLKKVLPMIRDHQELTFTILVTNDSYNIIQFGSYQHRGPDTVSNEYILWASM